MNKSILDNRAALKAEIDKIAEVTGLAQGTIKSHLSRGKMKLASYLKQNGYERK